MAHAYTLGSPLNYPQVLLLSTTDFVLAAAPRPTCCEIRAGASSEHIVNSDTSRRQPQCHSLPRPVSTPVWSCVTPIRPLVDCRKKRDRWLRKGTWTTKKPPIRSTAWRRPKSIPQRRAQIHSKQTKFHRPMAITKD